MVVLELELDDETARELVHEASEFDFPDREAYLRWLVEHRAVTFDGSGVERDRLVELEERLASLESRSDERGSQADPDRTRIKDRIDSMLTAMEGADETDIAESIPTIDEAIESDSSGETAEEEIDL